MIKDLDKKAKSQRKKYVYTKAEAFLRITPGNNSNNWPLPLRFFIISICLEYRNAFARFDEIPSMIL